MRVSLRRSISLATAAAIGCFAAFPAAAVTPAATPSQPGENPWNPWFQLGLIGSNHLNRAEGELFLPNGNDTTLAFLDIRGNFFTEDFDDKEIEGNFALGLRHMLEQGWNIGLWVGGDVREVESNNTFWQVSTGLEALHDNWDIRFNGYAPVTGAKRSRSGTVKVKLSGSNIFMTGGNEVPLFGYDGEVGGRIPLDKIGLDRDDYELRVFAGGFHYFDDDAKDSIAGPSTRLQGQIFDIIPGVPGSRLIAHAEYNWDNVRGSHVEGGLLLRIPLVWEDRTQAKPLSARSRQARRMLEPIVRDVDIIVSKSGKEKVEDALTDVRFDRVAYANAVDDITTTAATAGANSLIIADASEGDIDGGQVLLDDQTVVGGGAGIYVRGVDSGAIAHFEAPGSRPTIQLLGGDVGLTMANSTHAAGFDILGTSTGLGDEIASERGVDVPSATSNIFIEQLDLRSIGDTAINANGGMGIASHGISIFDVSIYQSADEGIEIEYGVSDVSIEHVTITDIDEEGIELNGANSNIRIYDVVIDGTNEEGIQISGDPSSDILISHVEISNADRHGISIGDGHTGITIEDSVITDTAETLITGGGIVIGDGNTDMVIRNVVIDGSGAASGLVFGADNVVTVDDVDFTGNFALSVIDFDGSGNTATGSGNTSDATFGTSFCEDVGGNPLSDIQFEDGSSCP